MLVPVPKRVPLLYLMLILLSACLMIPGCKPAAPDAEAPQRDLAVLQGEPADTASGFIVADGYKAVQANCMSCHSAKLVTQQGLSRDAWLESIRWMQQNHGLWELDEQTENTILDYLSTHYGPAVKPGQRRAPLVVEWEE